MSTAFATGLSLDDLQGRWQHSLVELGLLTVFDSVAFLDRGTALRLTFDKDGLITAGGWVVVPGLSNAWHVIWARSGTDVELPEFFLRTSSKALNPLRLAELKNYDMCAWRRVDSSDPKFMLDRWAGGPQPIFEGPETVALFTVPPPASTPAGVRPARLLVYGDSLTAGWPHGDPYARSLVDALGQEGVFAEVVGCGLGSVTARAMMDGVRSKDLRDCNGLRGEGLERLVKSRGPFDLAIIMAGTVDVVRGEPGLDALRLHLACHRSGLRTAALAVPPTWHDDPEAFAGTEVQRMQAMYNVRPDKVASLKAALNAKLQELASSPLPQSGARCELFVETAEIVPCTPDNPACWNAKDWLHYTMRGSQQFGGGLATRLHAILPASVASGGGDTPPGTAAGTPDGVGPGASHVEPAATGPTAVSEAGLGEASTPLPYYLVARDPILRNVLRFARPDWTNQELMTVMDKLSQAKVTNRAELLAALRGDGGDFLNAMLKRAGHKAFSATTLQLLRDQFDMSGMGVREEVVAFFRVVHDFVVVRRLPFRDAKALGTKRCGEVLAANAETYDGWLRLHDQSGWVLRDMRGENGLGTLLEPHTSEG